MTTKVVISTFSIAYFGRSIFMLESYVHFLVLGDDNFFIKNFDLWLIIVEPLYLLFDLCSIGVIVYYHWRNFMGQ